MATSAGAPDFHSASLPPAPAWRNWLIRRRVAISLTVFTSLVLLDMFLLGIRPRNIFDWSDPGTIVGELLVAIGLAIRSWAAGVLHKSKRLVQQGPYALIRNPLYVGSFCMMLGFCTLVQDSLSIWFVIGPVAALYWLQIRHEEGRLAVWFPGDWPAYAARTPRFLPRVLSRDATTGWTPARWLHNREYKPLLSSLVAFAGLYIWRVLSG